MNFIHYNLATAWKTPTILLVIFTPLWSMHYQLHNISWLQVLTAHQPDVSSVTVEILTKAGSIYETREMNGISHFLEHMFFKGGKKYPTPHSVAEAVDSFWGEFNAFTSDEYAGYYVKCAPGFVHQAVDVLSDMLVDAQFPEDEMQREKSVVIQEMAMYEDMPNRLVYDKWKEWYYGDNSYGRPTIGSEQTVNSFTREDLFRHKEALYSKDNLIIVVAGNIQDEGAVLDQIGSLFDRLPLQKSWYSPIYTPFKPAQRSAFYDKKTSQNHLIISADGFAMTDPMRYTARLLGTILGGNMSSRLFQEIREKKGLCYYIHASHESDSDSGVFYISAGIEKARREFGVQAIYDEVANIVSHGISEKEYLVAQGNLAGSTQMGIETTDTLANFLGRQQLLKGYIETLDDVLQKYQAVTKEQVESCAKELLSEEKLWKYWIQ
jgi:predicted Zn-dependent peptidase